MVSSQVPLDRPMVPLGVKLEAPGLPNDWFWVPKVTVSVSKMTGIGRKSNTFQQRRLTKT